MSVSKRNLTTLATTLFVVIAIFFSFTQVVWAQSTIDLIIHYVQGTPIAEKIAYNVQVFLSLIDSNGNPIKNLTEEDISVIEDSRKIQISSVRLASDEPVNLVLVFDTSGSMSGTGIEEARQAAKNFINNLGPQDRVAIISFNETITPIIDFTSDLQAAIQQLDLIEAERNSGTCLYNAAYQAAQIAATLPSGRRAIVLLTDGVDETFQGGTCSTFTVDDVIDYASGGITRVPLFTLGVGSQIDEQVLQRMAALTGGRYLHAPMTSQLGALFQRLSDLLKSQYVVEYESTAAPGAHSIVVEIEYLGSSDQDTRDFLLPALPPSLTIVSPTEGQEVKNVMTIVASVVGRGEVIEQVTFQVGGTVVETVSTVPYEADISLDGYDPGGLSITATAYGESNKELASHSITVYVPDDQQPQEPDTGDTTEEGASAADGIAASVTPTTPPSDSDEDGRGNIFSTVLICLGGLGLMGFVIYRIIKRRQGEQDDTSSFDDFGFGVESDQTQPTLDGLDFDEAYGLLKVIYSDEQTMIGQEFRLTKPVTMIGRSANNDVILGDTPVSRDHAQIERKGNSALISDLGSKYGTFVRGKKLEQESIPLANGDEIQLGSRTRLRFDILSRDMLAGDDPTFDDLKAAPFYDETNEFGQPGGDDYSDETQEFDPDINPHT